MTYKPDRYERYDERTINGTTLKLLRCDATTKAGTQCRLTPIYRHPDGRLLCDGHAYWGGTAR